MITVSWRLAAHPQDQASIVRFSCTQSVSPRPKKAAHHPEPFALEAERILRTHLRDASRDSRRRQWRFILGEDEDGAVAAAFVHRGAPDFAGPPIPHGVPVRLLMAMAVRYDLRGSVVTPGGGRLSDDARRATPGGILLARVHPANTPSGRLLDRHGFRSIQDGSYLTYARAL
ncbi:MAG: hypothetical protein NTU77_13770 [Actinobacteria bacterium]|nr:hypothetical protein [Actinomycetota bacterium]